MSNIFIIYRDIAGNFFFFMVDITMHQYHLLETTWLLNLDFFKKRFDSCLRIGKIYPEYKVNLLEIIRFSFGITSFFFFFNLMVLATHGHVSMCWENKNLSIFAKPNIVQLATLQLKILFSQNNTIYFSDSLCCLYYS